MIDDDFIEILQITGAFGIRGFLRALLYSDNIKKYRAICDASGKEYEFRIVRFISGNSVALSLEGITDRNTAESLRGTSFFVKKSDLPKLSDSEFYIADLIGKTVRVQGSDVVCTIVSVCNYGAGDLLELQCDANVVVAPQAFTADRTRNVDSASASNIVLAHVSAGGEAINARGATTFMFVPFTKENFPESDDGSMIITLEAFNWYRS